MQRNRAINETVSIRDDFIRENIKRDVAQNTKLDFVALFGWIGSILLCLSPLFNLVVWCSLAILGLTLLTFQAYKNKAYQDMLEEYPEVKDAILEARQTKYGFRKSTYDIEERPKEVLPRQ